MTKAVLSSRSIVPAEQIAQAILFVRGHKVIMDTDLALLYRVQNKALIRAMKRNAPRFPTDFAFQLSKAEFENLRYQFGTSSYGGRRYLPYVFTEQGVAMLSSVLRSKRAVQVNIEIMRTFVKLRRILDSHVELSRKLASLEKKYDHQFKIVFDAIRQLMAVSEDKPRQPIGFRQRR